MLFFCSSETAVSETVVSELAVKRLKIFSSKNSARITEFIYLFCRLSHGEKTLEAKANVFLRVTGE